MPWLGPAILAIVAVTVLYPALRRGYFSSMLVVGNLMVYILSFVVLVLQPGEYVSAYTSLAFRPVDLQVFRWHTLVSAMFLHAVDPFHVVSNVVALYLLGLPMEEKIRGRAFALIYFSTGIAATLIYGVVNWGDTTPALGASGAVMGIAGAFLVLYPRERIFMFLGFLILPRVPVYLAVTVILGWQFVLLVFDVPGIAVEAHLAGVATGILFAPLIVRGARLRAARPVRLDLEDLATTEELQEVLRDIQQEGIPEVREAWLDHFLEKARCPRCQGRLTREGGEIVSDCGWRRRL